MRCSSWRRRCRLWAASYRIAWSAARHRTTNMNTLIVVETTAAYGFAVFATFFPRVLIDAGLGQPLYDEVAAVIVALVLLGRYSRRALVSRRHAYPRRRRFGLRVRRVPFALYRGRDHVDPARHGETRSHRARLLLSEGAASSRTRQRRSSRSRCRARCPHLRRSARPRRDGRGGRRGSSELPWCRVPQAPSRPPRQVLPSLGRCVEGPSPTVPASIRPRRSPGDRSGWRRLRAPGGR